MWKHNFGRLFLPVLAIAPYLALTGPQESAPSFEQTILPIFKAHCSSCHAGSNPAAGLNLMSADGVKKGNVVSPGSVDKSKLYRRITSDADGPRMPKGFQPLSDRQISSIRDWIAGGASFEPSINVFAASVQPILKAKCYGCHSTSNKGGGLDLTSEADIRRVAIPGNVGSSLLVQRLTEKSGKPRMPLNMPPLTEAEQLVLRNWIREGAVLGVESRIHWAYRTPIAPTIPNLDGKQWRGNPIDAFVGSRLVSEGLQMSPPASREKQIRRLYLDVIGMPPTLAELNSALSNWSEASYLRLADRLLQSKHYGEHQARYWLDLARYADTDGYEADVTRVAWKYRDWVIDAFNRNVPFDDFTIQQLAGDMLPNATTDQLVATGFHRNSMFNREGGVDPKESRYETIIDRVNTTSDVWLGSTVQCARCHDHKYDPFTQEDYFRLYAVFANTEYESRGDANLGAQKFYEPEIRVPSQEQLDRQAALKHQIAQIEKELVQSRPELEADFAAWKSATSKPPAWTVLPYRVTGEGLSFETLSDGSTLAVGALPDNADYVVSLTTAQATTGLKLDAIPDARFPGGGSGRSSSGNFILSRVNFSAEGQAIKAQAIVPSFIQDGYSISGLNDDNGDTGWALYPQVKSTNSLVFEFSPPIPKGSQLTIVLSFRSKTWKQHLLGRFHITATSSPYPSAYSSASPIRNLLSKPSLTSDERQKIRLAFANASPALAESRNLLEQLRGELSKLEAAFPTAMILREKKGSGTLKAPIHHRGEFLSPGELVSAGVPKFLPGPTKAQNFNRLSLAIWLVLPSNPLTARVLVNRVWAQYFGRGLVETQEDFGTQGGAPSHPELLDWLATSLIANKWNLKWLHKTIVTSYTYRQDSRATPELRERDPDNVLLARGPRYRLDAEAIRDVVLQSSGLLHKAIGGPSVFPYQPDGVWNSPFSGEVWKQSTGQDLYRRGLYTFWKRTSPFPAFSTMDATSRESCTIRRTRTNTPLQALAMLNDKMILDASRALGQRMASALTVQRGIADAFRACTSRNATQEEMNTLLKLFERTRQQYWRHRTAAKKLGDDATHAASTVVANVLLNLDETITKE